MDPSITHKTTWFRPAQITVLALGIVITVGTVLLMLPVSRTGAPLWPTTDTAQPVIVAGSSLGSGAPFSVALFTATSASCVTGLIVADTASYWSHFGQAVIAILIEFGGLGTMTFAAIMALYVAEKLNLRRRLAIAKATSTLTMEDIRGVVKRIIWYSFGLQAVFAIPLIVDFYVRTHSIAEAFRNGLFFSLSAFNNAGFSLHKDSLIPYSNDPVIILTISTLIVVGGLGFPVVAEVGRALKNHYTRGRAARLWSLNARLVFVGTAFLILVGWLLIAIVEWNNKSTIGQYSTGHKLLVTLFSSVSPRTAGFNAMDISGQSDVTWLVTDALMFVGGGPAGTAGGVKVTTTLILIFMVFTEVRAGKAVQMFGARIGRSTHRTAVTVLLLSFTLVVIATGAIMAITPWGMDQVLFEVLSALGTVGLSTGITPHLPILAQLIICMLMFFGRLGPMNVATAMAVRPDSRLFELPKERPIIG